MEKLSVGIVGYGRIGNEHAGWLTASAACRVGGVFDPTPARRAVAAAAGWAATDSLDALLANSRIEAVLISTPTSMHHGHALAAIAAGKHVMVEKPVALDLQQAIEIRDAAAKAGVTLSVFHCRRWDADYLTVRDAVASGVLGRLINIESRLGQFASCVGPAAVEYRPGWRNEGTFGGGGLYDWGSHFVDQLWQLLLPAKPVRVFAQLRGNVWTRDCDDFARVLIDFDDGCVGLCEINTTTTRPLPRWHLDGTHGSAGAPPSDTFDTRAWAKLHFTPADGTAPRDLPVAAAGLSESAIWDRFASACRGDGLPAVDIDSVLITTRLLDAARLSSATGRAVDFSPSSSATAR